MFDAVRSCLTAARRVLLISHVAPDGDAIGSLLGLYALLQEQGYQATPANPDEVPPFLRFLPGWEDVVQQADEEFDLVVALDSSDLPRLGALFDPQRYGHLPLVNVDHHVTNLGYGTVNVVDPSASSTCEVVYRLALALGWPISPRSAQCLLTGIVTDTQGFRTANVTADLLGIAQRLMEAGASLPLITENAFGRSSLASICLWGQALTNVRLEDRIIWTAIPLNARARCYGVEQSDTGLASFLVAAEEADVSVVLTERKDGKVDVGLRAKRPFDVSQVALSLGGGGHPLAAGCTLAVDLETAQRLVLAALRPALEAQRAARPGLREASRT
ncbi:MAG: bifunctional oligoribonuclease/PAP phosphatase NrnA [Caldilineales bacterium]|nr:bifunctional oligoribonuclease/PAP phosphatase NrnA [Caldilineales bacterium]MDW8319371.1 bifunctional oligoribonuclease/PAP phosphatase NrnA [Anaerolineae bacterium]